MESIEISEKPKVRLKFIDMARSIAILMMLEGHFIDETLSDVYRDESNILYAIWHNIRGFTAPLFFTVTGLIFVYLLTKHKQVSFWKNKRITKGFRRSFELVFWGYFLQIFILDLYKFILGNARTGSYGFHVLQSIGVAIFVILIIYRLYTLIKVIPLWLYYFTAAICVISIFPFLQNFYKDQYLPENYHYVFQNLIRGPHSHFPIVPWLSFSLFGAMIGSILGYLGERVRENWFPSVIISIGLTLNLIIVFGVLRSIDYSLGDFSILGNNYYFSSLEWIFSRFGQVLIVLGILMFIDKYVRIKDNLFIKTGQSTLQIFIVHFIILYGGIFGIRLNKYFQRNLDPYQAVLGAILFVLFFLLFTKYLGYLTPIWKKFLDALFYPLRKLKTILLKD